MKLVCAFVFALALSVHAADVDLSALAARATNELAVDLYRFGYNENLCLSPYSIESALAMTFAGADGETKTEMARVLHFPNSEDAIHGSFAELQHSLNEMAKKTVKIAEESKTKGGPSEPITLSIANRLFAQSDYEFRNPFQALVKKFYGAPFEPLDFKKDPEAMRGHINKWVAEQTRNRIRDLIPQGGIEELTRLVLANAIYLKAPWASEFNDALTKPKPFQVRGYETVNVPTMNKVGKFGYGKQNRLTAVAIPYSGSELQFVILLPDTEVALRDLTVDPDLLAECTKLKPQDVDLELPKFKFEPPTIPLGGILQSLGMKTAFDDPQGSANFDKIAPRKPNQYLAISNVFHKTFIAVDEKGTEAAAATAVIMREVSARLERKEPIHVKVDRPFIYAIQHVPSGACLFIGRVTDPQ
jgi:serpin B